MALGEKPSARSAMTKIAAYDSCCCCCCCSRAFLDRDLSLLAEPAFILSRTQRGMKDVFFSSDSKPRTKRDRSADKDTPYEMLFFSDQNLTYVQQNYFAYSTGGIH